MKRALKWAGLALGSLLALALVLLVSLYFVGSSKIDAPLVLADEPLAVSADSAALAHGEYLVDTHACRDCHGEQLQGRVFVDAPPFLVTASNLTSGSGGIGGTYSDADWERAIRHGVGAAGRRLVVMPSALYHSMSDEELGAMVAYLKKIPPVDNELPETEVRPLGRVLAGAGNLYTADAAVDHTEPHLAIGPTRATSVEYGRYRASTICTYCHGENLEGGHVVEPGTPPAPDLRSVRGWSFGGFEQAMRTGVTPTGYELMPEVMPWPSFQHMTEEELRAIYGYLQTLSGPAPDDA